MPQGQLAPRDDTQASLRDGAPTALRNTATQRSNVVLSNRSDPRSQRVITPSPLQSSQISNPPDGVDSRPTSASPRSPAFPTYGNLLQARSPLQGSPRSQDQVRSTREKLDALLGTERASGSRREGNAADAVDRRVQKVSRLSPQGPLRTASAPVQPAAVMSPYTSPAVVASSSSPSQSDTRPAVPRTVSIDSALSSVSSNASQSYRSNASRSHRSSQDTISSNSPDVSSAIAAAGSAEAAIQKLLDDNAKTSAHNATMWRLLEKQRELIKGLNKDLERAGKDKERFRKKLKDHLVQSASSQPPLDMKYRADTMSERGNTPSPALSDRRVDPLEMSSLHDVVLRPTSVETQPMPGVGFGDAVSPANLDTLLPPSDVLSSIRPNGVSSFEKPRSYAPTQDVFPPTHGQNNMADRFDEPMVSEHQTINSTSPVSTVATLARLEQYPASSSSMHAKSPSLWATEPTTLVGPGGLPSPVEQVVPSPRRKAPAPLNLSSAGEASAHLHQTAAGERSDSEYDDIIEAEDVPRFDRGRRKTREDDDRQREALLVEEQEHRSRSKKDKKSKSKSTSKGKSKSKSKSKSKARSETVATADKADHPVDDVRYPATQTRPSAGWTAHTQAFQSASGSISALLDFANPERIPYSQRSAVAPLKSPGLPMSPRPTDRPLNSPMPRMPNKSFATVPTPSRPGFPGLPLSPRAPKQAIPFSSYTTLSPPPPRLPQVETYRPQPLKQSPSAKSPEPSPQSSPECERPGTSTHLSSNAGAVYQGLVSEQYPDLLLPPNALPSIDVKVHSSRLRPSRNSHTGLKASEEDPVFTLAIFARSDGKQLWRVEKALVALPTLDQQVKTYSAFHAKLPDRSLFSGHAPAKIDARRAALNAYFETMLDTHLEDRAALAVCKFFSTDVIDAERDSGYFSPSADSASLPGTKGRLRKVGYLTKRGKNFGGWKTRYFVLDGPDLRYFESPGGAHLGSIKLANAQIGKQSQQPNESPSRQQEDAENQYRHAFLVLEPRRRDSASLVRHVLCAESDGERDSWVEALLQYVDDHDDEGELAKAFRQSTQPGSARSANSKTSSDTAASEPRGKERPQSGESDIQSVNYNDTVAATAPVLVAPNVQHNRTPSPTHATVWPSHSASQAPPSHPAISGPTNGVVIQNLESWGNKPMVSPLPKEREPKKRSIFGFRGRSSSDTASWSQANQMGDQAAQNRQIFGIPLAEAVEISPPIGVDVYLPAVVYRCIEYLNARHATSEEGIFRLSGSNVVIKELKARFNHQGDVKLLDGQYYDVHAVASLLKQYLRDLPSSILTRDLHIDFLRVLDMVEQDKKVAAFTALVHRLPRANAELLQALTGFLLDVTDNADVNKMNVRNVGIVFAPTLNIPAPLISMFLTEFNLIFGNAVDEAPPSVNEIIVTASPPTPEAIRSPRKQVFSDLPTPSYHKTQFHDPLNASAYHHFDKEAYDTGFIPLQPSYEAPMYPQQLQPQPEGAYDSFNGALAPTTSREPQRDFTTKDAKQKRRESGMMIMNMGLAGQRRTSTQRLREKDEARRSKEQIVYD